ncbi:glycerophosphodiester phosphodiesterase [Fodinibius salicampi]|nr:glycerophosphodiester phosphodiesterase family protein [Fodinibius salicampi]
MSQDLSLPVLYHSNDDSFLVIAHRGASAQYPENTMPAFKGAVEMEAEMIELDVMMSSDGVPVVFHDARLDDHSDGKGLLKDYTLRELRTLDVGSWFSEQYRGEKMPTLEEAIEFASGKIALNIEIKTEAVSDELHGGVEEKSLELVKKYGMEDHVIFSSFDYRALEHLKKLDPAIPVALLYNRSESENMSPLELVRKYGVDAFNCSYNQFKKKWSRELKEHNIPHFIYTVDQPRRMRRLLSAEVSGIFTNKPDLLKEVATEFQEKE